MEEPVAAGGAAPEPRTWLRLDSIRNQLIAFAVLAALIPAITIAAIAYQQTRKALVENITAALSSTSSQGARELDLWAKERAYDLRVYTGSYEVLENLERAARSRDVAARNRLTRYLDAVRGRTGDYELLAVTNLRGTVAAVSPARGTRPEAALTGLPADWLATVGRDETVLGDAFWDEAGAKTVVTFAVPVTTGNGRSIGALVARFNLGGVAALLSTYSRGEAHETYVVTTSGRFVTGADGGSAELMRSGVPADPFAALAGSEGAPVEYTGADGREFVAVLHRVPRSAWSVLAQVPVVEAYARMGRVRNIALVVFLALVFGIGWLAYRLGLLIVRPLDRLTRAATTVAGGDLAVEIPVTGGGEVASLTHVFNDMVTRLRTGRQELERLSTTDSLTRLYNRRYLMTRLDEEGRRARRTDRPFSLLMIDVDHFKRFNDTYGHHAGDEVLAGVAAVFQECVREVDCAARYGGEEFVIVLPETPAEGAIDVAARIRARLAAENFPGGKVTLSIGIAEFPADGETPEFVLRAADAALYRAKREGRDRVLRAVRGRFSGDVRPHDPAALRGSRGARSARTPGGGPTKPE
jgi:diguanylate cyclase (GGDEF)-like protein